MLPTIKLVSMQQGKYEIDPRKNKKEMAVTETTVPYTDEYGYYLIGAFPYGRALNAACIASNTDELPVMKEIYLTTMARPVYTNESEGMGILFWNDKEGAVPGYLNIGDEEMPPILGMIGDVDLEKHWSLEIIPTEDKKKKSRVKEIKNTEVTKEVLDKTTNPKQTSSGGNNKVLVNKTKPD